MSRSMRIVLSVVAAQALLIGVYWLVEHRRPQEGLPSPDLSTAAPQRVDGSVPALSLRARDGNPVDLPAVRRPTLLHFWATWCPPCRTELPGLLALSESEEQPLNVMAVALDEEWASVDRFLSGRRASSVLLGNAAEIERALGVRTLPVTYLVGPRGQLRFRFDGARDWTDSAFLRTWMEDIGSE